MTNTKGNALAETTKTLGPTSAHLILRLSADGKTIFTTREAQAITGTAYQATSTLLSDLVQKGWLIRLIPGKYLIIPLEAGLESIPMADRYVIAREVLGSQPHYMSHYTAMALHQMTTQPVNVVYVTVPCQRASRSIAGIPYHFPSAGPRSFWGWESLWVTDEAKVNVSDLEKTLLDCAVRPHLCGGIGELAKGLWLRKQEVDEKRLIAYLKRLNHRAAVKRIGFLLETFDLAHPETITALRSLINERYTRLDPTLPDEGPYRARWRLRVNLDPEELKAIIWT